MPNLFAHSEFELAGTLADENLKNYFIDDGAERIRIPKSQVRNMRLVGRPADYVLTIPYWLAKDRGIA
jgi:hypothetical protein